MSSTTESARRRDIKAGNSVADLRRRRSSMAVSLRKAKKEQGQAKRRNTARPASTPASAEAPGSSAKAGGQPQQQPVTAADVPELARALGGAPEGRVEAARGLRKVLSLESDPPVTEVIEAGAMPLLVLCLDEHSNTDLQVSPSLPRKALSFFVVGWKSCPLLFRMYLCRKLREMQEAVPPIPPTGVRPRVRRTISPASMWMPDYVACTCAYSIVPGGLSLRGLKALGAIRATCRKIPTRANRPGSCLSFFLAPSFTNHVTRTTANPSHETKWGQNSCAPPYMACAFRLARQAWRHKLSRSSTFFFFSSLWLPFVVIQSTSSRPSKQ